MSEKTLHKAVCDYLKLKKVIFNTDMSGIKLTIGQATQAKQLRSHNGFPDIMVFEPRGKWHGLFIELKKEGIRVYKKNGELSVDKHVRDQAHLHSLLRTNGYFADFAIGFDNAKRIIDNYLKL